MSVASPTNQNVQKVSAHTNWIKKMTKGWEVGSVKNAKKRRRKEIVVDLETAFVPQELL